MIPVMQTKTVIKNSNGDIVTRGNCYAACIASILEVQITDVPNVETLFHIEGSFWIEVMLTFLNSKGWDLCSDNILKRFHPKETGWADFSTTNNSQQTLDYYEYKKKNYLVSGLSVRGFHHTCIYKHGVLVHDPHPTKEGLVTLEDFYTLEKING